MLRFIATNPSVTLTLVTEGSSPSLVAEAGEGITTSSMLTPWILHACVTELALKTDFAAEMEEK